MESIKLLKTWASKGLMVVLSLAAVAGVWTWYHPEVKIVDRWHPAPAPSIVEKIKTITVPVKEIIVLEKEAAASKLNLPESIREDKGKEITAAAEVAAYEGKTTVASIIDLKSGKTEIIQHQEPVSFLAFESKKELYLRAGMNSDGDQRLEIGGRWDFLRVGNGHLGFYGRANNSAVAEAGVQVNYRW